MTSNPTYEVSSTGGSKTELTAEGITSSEGEETEWLEEEGQANGKPSSGIRFKKPGRSSQLTRLEKIFLLLLLLLSVALIIVIVALTIQVDKDDKEVTAINGAEKLEGDAKLCTSTECVMTAAEMNGKLDHSVHPCDDFFQFACGTWVKKRVIPADRGQTNVFADLRDEMNIVIKNLMETDISPTEKEYTAKAKTFYKSCLNYDLINERGTKPYIDYITAQFGPWPLITKDWDDSSFDFTDTFIKLNEHNRNPLLAIYVDVNARNSTQRILMMDQAGLLMPGQKYYLVPRNDSMLKAYEKLIYKFGNYFGFADPATAENEINDMLEFEIKLAKIHVPQEDRRDNNKLYNPMTLQEVNDNYGQILDWKRFFNHIMKSPGIEVLDVSDDEIIINRSPSFFEKLVTLLDETPRRTLVNYLIWGAVRGMSYTQGQEIQELYREYNKILYDIENRPPRYRTCVSNVLGGMGLAVSKLYIKDNFDAESKVVALEMIKDLHQSFDDLLRENDWMDDNTKEVAKEKNRFIAPHIGYPADLMNETFMMELYENLTFHEDEYMENSLKIRKDRYKSNMKDLRLPVDKKKNIFIPSQVNAFYNPLQNQITFPAGILQPPFFKKTFPKSLNYGGIGVVIGHEITHGFDDRGRQYDKEGNLVQWWSEDAIDRFKVKSQCIVDQYGNFTVKEVNMNLNGINTQGENIADNGGVKQAFNAYRNWVARQGKEEDPLPGLPYTHNQLFFINFAQLWCSKMTEGDAINRIRTGVHSPGEFRVIGSVQNSEDFSRAFNCPTTSDMNPQKKCSVW